MESHGKQQPAHIVFVHGACHGAWCWFKLKPLLEAAGHRITALDLAASGVNSTSLHDLRSLEDYTRPLLDMLAAIPSTEKVILVGHSLGGLSLAVAMDKYPDRIAAAVFVAAFMPDSDQKPSYVVEQYIERIPPDNWEDTEFLPFGDPEAPLTSMFFGPKFVSKKLYNLCQPEDMALAMSLIRPSSLFVEDLEKKEPFSKTGFGSVKRVYIMCRHDMAIPIAYQRWQVDTFGVDQVLEIPEADHMPMMCTPRQLSELLVQIVKQYA